MSNPTHDSPILQHPRRTAMRGLPGGEQPRMNRRDDLLRSLGAVGSLALLGCRDILTPEAQTVGGSVDPTAVPAATGSTQPPAGVAVPSGSQSPANPAPACVLTPRQTEGPFYFDPKQIRRNITEGRPGTPLQVALQVVEAGTCRPIQDALVDIWHADVIGVYSGYTRQGERGELWTPRARRFSEAARSPLRTGWSNSSPSTPVGIPVVPCISTSRCALPTRPR